MGFYLSIKPEKEIIERIKYVDTIRENLIDLKGEYNVIKERNPLVKSKGSGDYSRVNSGSIEGNPEIAEFMRCDYLRKKITEYTAIINDFDIGWRLLTDREKIVLTSRYVENKKLDKVEKDVGYSIKQLLRIEEEAMRKLKLHMNLY